MTNMSYCRFQNTLTDLRDCVEHMSEDDMSDHELRARQSMIALCREIAEDFPEE